LHKLCNILKPLKTCTVRKQFCCHILGTFYADYDDVAKNKIIVYFNKMIHKIGNKITVIFQEGVQIKLS